MTTINDAGWGMGELPQTDEETLTTFPEEWKNEFEGLLYLGYLQKEVTSIPFHRFVIRTLTVNDKLEISLLVKPYLETIGYNRAYKSAIVAAGLVSVDGKELVPTSKNTNVLRQKYDYVTDNWYDVVIDFLYRELDQLEEQVIRVLQELGILESPGADTVFVLDGEGNDNPKGGS